MRRVLPAALAVLALGALPAHAREPGLWATINLCDPPAKPGAVGVRVSIPRHGTARHRQQQWARIRIQWFNGTSWDFIGPSGDSGYKHLGHGRGMIQGGTTFTFQPPPPGERQILRGLVDVQWRLGRKVTGRTTLQTESGHANPKQPILATSQASCEISR